MHNKTKTATPMVTDQTPARMRTRDYDGETSKRKASGSAQKPSRKHMSPHTKVC